MLWKSNLNNFPRTCGNFQLFRYFSLVEHHLWFKKIVKSQHAYDGIRNLYQCTWSTKIARDLFFIPSFKVTKMVGRIELFPVSTTVCETGTGYKLQLNSGLKAWHGCIWILVHRPTKYCNLLLLFDFLCLFWWWVQMCLQHSLWNSKKLQLNSGLKASHGCIWITDPQNTAIYSSYFTLFLYLFLVVGSDVPPNKC